MPLWWVVKASLFGKGVAVVDDPEATLPCELEDLRTDQRNPFSEVVGWPRWSDSTKHELPLHLPSRQFHLTQRREFVVASALVVGIAPGVDQALRKCLRIVGIARQQLKRLERCTKGGWSSNWGRGRTDGGYDHGCRRCARQRRRCGTTDHQQERGQYGNRSTHGVPGAHVRDSSTP